MMRSSDSAKRPKISRSVRIESWWRARIHGSATSTTSAAGLATRPRVRIYSSSPNKPHGRKMRMAPITAYMITMAASET